MLLLSVVLSTSALQVLHVLRVLRPAAAAAACTCPPATPASQVCGSDRQTYGSRCLLDCADVAGLSVAHSGPCLTGATMSWRVNASLLSGAWSRPRRWAEDAKQQYDICKIKNNCHAKTCSECGAGDWKCEQKCQRNCWCACAELPGSGLDEFDQWDKCFFERECWPNNVECKERCFDEQDECSNDCSMDFTKCDCECNQQKREQPTTPLSTPRPSGSVATGEVTPAPELSAAPAPAVTASTATQEVSARGVPAPEVTTAGARAVTSAAEEPVTPPPPGASPPGHDGQEPGRTTSPSTSPSPRCARTEQGAGPKPGGRGPGAGPGAGPSAARRNEIWEWLLLALSACAVASVSVGVCVLARARPQVVCCVYGQGHRIVHGAGAGAGAGAGQRGQEADWANCRSKAEQRDEIELTSFTHL
ncbi:SPARC-like protein 1 [Frankliniella fusca]|uniref:SPARC-like protein 1 n=1 Tax=Frankliniella fusca TaxID=407009 RepID=A0AAE1I5J2_9NEOP|nr:SPARC-like protein 1 [Frankliniella fusca]